MILVKTIKKYKAMKKQAKYSQAEMARLLEVSQQYISFLLNNKAFPSYRRTKIFAKKTKTTPFFWFNATKKEKTEAITRALNTKKRKERTNGTSQDQN